MHNAATDCNPAALESLLEGRLTEPECQALERHLEQCPACRSKLDELAALPQEWQELRQQLSAADGADDSSFQSRPSTAGGKSPLDILKYLAPTDDPQMLGRLGGYEIMGVIGAGGMGVVLKGLDRSLNRFVAIKALAPAVALNAVARRRFSREAQAAAAVVHENVIAIHGVSEANGLPFLVMPYVRGQSLERRIEQRGVLSVLEVLRISHQVASGLAAAHAQGLVHRDIKPANILLEDGVERLKITDFGLARGIDDVSITQTGVIAGTPQFMSPEQSRGEPIDRRSDLFSLGSLMYMMATGCPPFRGDTTLSVLHRISHDEPTPMRRLNPEVPQWLDDVVRKLHCKSPEGRFQSAKELADHLEACLAHLQHPLDIPAPPRLNVSSPRQEKIEKSKRIAGAAMLLAVAAAVAWYGVAGDSSSDDSRANPAGAASNRAGEAAATSPKEAPASLPFQKLPLSIPQLPEFVRSMSFSQDGNVLAVAHSNHRGTSDPGSGSVYIWDLAENKVRARFQELHGITSVTLSPDAARVAYGTFEKLCKVCDVATGREILREAMPVGSPAVAFSPDGKRLAAADMSGAIALWDTQTWARAETVFGGDPIPLLSLAFSPDGTKLAACGGTFPPDKLYGQAAVWDVQTGQRIVTVGHTAAIMDIEFAPDGEHFATAGLDTRCKVWELSSGDAVQTYRDPESGIVRARFFPDGKTLATLGPTSGIKLWSRDATEPFTRLRFDDAYLTALGVSPNGKLMVSGGHDRVVRLWDGETHKSLSVLRPGSDREALRGPILAVACSPDDKLLALGREDGAIVLRRAADGELVGTLEGHEDQVTSLLFNGDGTQLVSGSYDNTIRVWDLETGLVSRTLDGHDNWVMCLALSPDGKQLASGSYDRTVRVWDLAEAQEERRWIAHEASVRAVAFSPSGDRLLTAGSDRLAKLWDPATGELLQSFDAHKKAIRAACFSPDGATIATASEDARILLWDAKTGFDRRTLTGHSGMVWALSFSRDGKMLVSGGDDRAVRVWDLASLKQRQALAGHADSITALVQLRSAGTLVSASLDGTIKLWAQENAAIAADPETAGKEDSP